MTASFSSFVGTMVRVLMLTPLPLCSSVAFRFGFPSLNQDISGRGDPPEVEQERFMLMPSVATGARGEMMGWDGFTKTVILTLLV